jgi:hypothetical protein
MFGFGAKLIFYTIGRGYKPRMPRLVTRMARNEQEYFLLNG